jgi:zinc transporter 9
LWYDALAEGAEAHEHEEHEGGGEHHHHGGHGDNWKMGAALGLGFAFMLVVEQLSAGYGHVHGADDANSEDEHSHGASALKSSAGTGVGLKQKEKNASAMVGLIIHAATDGVALGASIAAGNSSTSSIVFLAIMLHKAPAAFGLTAYLNNTGEKKRVVMQQLLIFSFAAPVGAAATYFGMALGLGLTATKIALVMLFSGGTFLFVATVHILPELITSGGALTWAEVWMIVFGIMFPAFINVEHGH